MCSILVAGLLLGSLAPAAAQEPSEEAPEAAKEQAALLWDNQRRCLRLAQGVLMRMQMQFDAAYERTDEIKSYLKGEAQLDVAVAERSLAILASLDAAVARDAAPELATALGQMREANRQICERSRQPDTGWSGEAFQQTITDLVLQYNAAEKAMAPILALSTTEKQRLLAKFQERLYGSLGVASAPTSDDDEASAWVSPLTARPITPEEYRKKQKEYEEWTAEQERIRRERQAKEAEWRAAREQGLEATADRELPKVGLAEGVAPPPPPPPTDEAYLKRLRRWHEGYTGRILPLKKALAQYLQVQTDRPDLRMDRACRALWGAADVLLKDRAVLDSPDAAAAAGLRQAVSEFKAAAEACLAKDPAQRRAHMEVGEKALAQAAVALRAYGLAL